MKEYLGGDYESFVNGKQPEKVKAIDDGIAKMPKYDGAVYRGMHLNDSQVEQFRNLSAGDTIGMKSCSSWSSNKGVADRYGEQGDKGTNTVLFKCENNKSGAGVQHVSKWGNTEAEVLLPSTAKWKVKENNTMTKYDYLKDHYTNLAETATKPVHRKIAQKSLEDLEANKDAYMNTTVSVISLEEE